MTPQTLPLNRARGLRPPGVAAGPSVTADGSEAFRRSLMKPALRLVVAALGSAALQPLPRRHIQHTGDRNVTTPRCAFQACLDVRGYTPAVYLGLHALHCKRHDQTTAYGQFWPGGLASMRP